MKNLKEYKRLKQRHVNMTPDQIDRRRQYQRDWLNKRTPEQIEIKRKYNRRYFKNMTRSKIRDRTLKACYKITLVDWEKIFELQGKRCAICLTDDPCKSRHRQWHTDHCHKTNKIRGILCHHCNTFLGLSGENVETLASAIMYLMNVK